MVLTVAAGASNSFTLYEDDGETENYLNGAFVTTRFDLDWDDTAADLRINAANGDLSLIPDTRTYTITFKGFRKGCAFKINGAEHNAVYHAPTNSYTVEVEELHIQKETIITVSNEDGLIHNNSDCRDRICDLLYRSQTDTDTKLHLIRMVDNNPKDIQMRDSKDSLHGAVMEYLKQTDRV